MSTQTRLLLLLSALSLVFLGTLGFVRHLDGQRGRELARRVEREKRAAFERLVELKGSALASFVSDYTFWDEMVLFGRTGNRRWAAENIDTALQTFGADAAWVYRTDHRLLYATPGRGAGLERLNLPPEALPRLFAQRRFAHFFIRTPRGIMEVRGATIHPSADSQRTSVPRGYFLAGRLWTPSYLGELSRLIDGQVSLGPAAVSASGDGQGHAVVFARPLAAWEGSPLVWAQVRAESAVIAEVNRSARRQSSVFLLFSLVVLVVPSVLIARWVSAPLRKISAVLTARDSRRLGELPHDRSEFGHVARLILQFFEQSELIEAVTARRRTEEALRETEERFRDLVENASDVVFTHDIEGKFTSINQAGERLTGYRREDVLQMNVGQVIRSEVSTRRSPDLRDPGPDAGAWRYEAELLTRDGRAIPVEVVAGWVHAGGMPVGVQGIARDITERRRVEEEIRRINAQLEQRVTARTAELAQREQELAEAKAYLEHLIAGSPSVIFRIDPQNDAVTYISPNVQRFLGYAPAEVLRTPRFWAERTHPDDRPNVRAAAAFAEAEGVPQFESEYRFRHKDGSYRWLYSLTRVEYAGGRAVRILGYALGITERKAAEEALRQAQRQAEQASLAKNEFLSRMSHELRTPLNAILGFAQVLEMDALSVEQSDSVGHILKGGQHLLDLVNEVLDISRIETGRLTLSPEPVPVGEVLQEVVELIRPLAAQRAVTLGGEGLTTSEYVLADLQRLKQVLLNLLSNAVKYNRTGGSVTVSCAEVPDQRLRINITDTGRGVPPEKMDQLFVPFSRLGAEQEAVEGAGIGLALSKGLVELMGGEIGVESTVGQGSTFWVELPRVPGQLERMHRLPAGTPAVAAEVPAPPRTLLYIEDNLANLALLQRLLAERPQIRLLAAMQGRMGLDLARQHRPDLILLDIHLPDLPGEEVLRRLQADPLTRGIPVLVLTADLTGGQTERLLALGAHGYLTKPLDVKQFLPLLDDAWGTGTPQHVGRAP